MRDIIHIQRRKPNPGKIKSTFQPAHISDTQITYFQWTKKYCFRIFTDWNLYRHLTGAVLYRTKLAGLVHVGIRHARLRLSIVSPQFGFLVPTVSNQQPKSFKKMYHNIYNTMNTWSESIDVSTWISNCSSLGNESITASMSRAVRAICTANSCAKSENMRKLKFAEECLQKIKIGNAIYTFLLLRSLWAIPIKNSKFTRRSNLLQNTNGITEVFCLLKFIQYLINKLFVFHRCSNFMR